MAPFNVTCSVSRLPITPGTPVRTFMLARPRTPHPRMASMPTTHYLPLTTGVRAKYKDLAELEACRSTPAYKIAVRHFWPRFTGTPDDLFLHTRYQMEAEDYGPDKKPEAVLENAGEKIPCDVSAAYIREDVYRAVLRTAGAAVDAGKLAEDLKAAQKTVAGQRFNYLQPLFDAGEDGLFHAALQPYREALVAGLRNDSLIGDGAPGKRTMELAADIAEHLRFNRGLRELGIQWQPFATMAGRGAKFGLHRAFSEAVGKICLAEENKTPPQPLPPSPGPA